MIQMVLFPYKYKDREWLKNKYCKEKMSTSEIAKGCKVPGGLIWRWLKRLNIPTRSHHEANIIWHSLRNVNAKYKNREWLKEKYIEKQLSTVQIGKLCGANHHTIANWLRKYNIFRKMKLYQTKEWLYNKYWIEKLSAYQIAKLYGEATPQTIWKQLKKFNIPIRSPSEALLGNIPWNKGKKGQIPWNKGIKAKDDTRVKKFVEAGHKASVGRIPWNKGLKGFMAGPKNNMWKGGKIKIRCSGCGKIIERYPSLVYRRNNRIWCKECTATSEYSKTKEARENHQKAAIKRIMRGDYNWKPNKLEKYFLKLIPNKMRYTGDGQRWIETSLGPRNPDFEIKDFPWKIVEIFGDYWHSKNCQTRYYYTPDDLIQAYTEKGIKCLIFWEHEVYKDTKSVIKQVEDFIKT